VFDGDEDPVALELAQLICFCVFEGEGMDFVVFVCEDFVDGFLE